MEENVPDSTLLAISFRQCQTLKKQQQAHFCFETQNLRSSLQPI
jgi:hypothetical protein